MKRRINIWASLDWITILVYLVMIFFGWINIYAAVYSEEHTSILDFSQRYGKQLIWIIAAIVVASVVLIIDGRFYTFFPYPIYLIIIALLFGVLLFGKEVNGARSWFEIGSVSLQPSEFAKFATVLAVAKYLSVKDRSPGSFRNLILSMIIIFIPALFIMAQPDLGSGIVYLSLILILFREGLSPYLFITGILAAFIFIITLLVDSIYIFSVLIGLAFIIHAITSRNYRITIKGFIIYLFSGIVIYGIFRLLSDSVVYEAILIIALLVSGVSYSYYIFKYKARSVIILYTFLIGSMVFSYSVDYAFQNILKPHQQTRINVVLGIESDPTGAGYNLNQSKISIGSGGLAGKGFLKGTQTKYKFVPEQSTDFIFCTVGEEWGFLGTSFLIILYSFLLMRLIGLAERQRSGFSRIYGYGVVSILLFHFLINIGMTIGLVPVIGIPLPFFSYGGSSLWGFTILLFIFLRLDASRNEYLA